MSSVNTEPAPPLDSVSLEPGDDARVVLCTIEGEEAAASLAESLVAEKLAACVGASAPLRSVYRWEGQIQRSEEIQLTIKTTSQRLDALAARILELHPAEVPEILVVPVELGHGAYLAWLRRETDSDAGLSLAAPPPFAPPSEPGDAEPLAD